jgi:hypothetical protein
MLRDRIQAYADKREETAYHKGVNVGLDLRDKAVREEREACAREFQKLLREKGFSDAEVIIRARGQQGEGGDNE